MVAGGGTGGLLTGTLSMRPAFALLFWIRGRTELALQEHADDLPHDLEAEGLLKDRLRRPPEKLCVAGCVPGHEDDTWQRRREARREVMTGSQGLVQGRPIEPGHGQVAQDQGISMLLEPSEGVRPVLSAVDHVAILAQNVREQLPEGLVIIDD
jgi:hypothetical protein